MSRAAILVHEGKEYVKLSSYKMLKTKYQNKLDEIEFNYETDKEIAANSRAEIMNQIKILSLIDENRNLDIDREYRIKDVEEKAIEILKIFSDIKSMIKGE